LGILRVDIIGGGGSAQYVRPQTMREHRTFRLTHPLAPQKIVGVTLLLWALLLAFAWIVLRQPDVALIPLFGLYPGPAATDNSDHGVELVWAAGSALVFAALAFVGLFRKSRVAAIAFMVLFFASIAGWLLRFH
jgi:hypothetical protein